MVIVISNPTSLKDEHLIINQLFEEGLEYFHLRKPGCSVIELTELLDQIAPGSHSKISLHQHHELADSYGMQRLHFTEENRRSLNKGLIDKQMKEKRFSTSIHTPEEYPDLSSSFDYVFFGPVFNSISKPGYNSILKNGFKLPALRKTKMIALGGIDSSKIKEVKDFGFDGAGILGSIWNDSKNAVNNFKSIKKEWLR